MKGKLFVIELVVLLAFVSITNCVSGSAYVTKDTMYLMSLETKPFFVPPNSAYPLQGTWVNMYDETRVDTTIYVIEGSKATLYTFQGALTGWVKTREYLITQDSKEFILSDDGKTLYFMEGSRIVSKAIRYNNSKK